MPGRTPSEAVENFLGPLRRALACLGRAHISVAPEGRKPGDTRAWAINGGQGLVVAGWHIDAQMHYEIIRQDEGGWRVTTRAYRYRIACADVELALIHWHPGRRSPYQTPHVHLPHVRGEGGEKHHLPTGRLTFEDAVEWAIGLGVPAAQEGWRAILHEGRQLHVDHRSWHTSPDEVRET